MFRRIFKEEDQRLVAFNTLVCPIFDYGYAVWDPCLKKDVKLLQKKQNKTLGFIFKINRQTSFSQLHSDTEIMFWEECRNQLRKKLFLKSYASVIDLKFCVPIKPTTSDKENFTLTRQGAFLCLLLNHGNMFTHLWWLG